MKSLRADMQEMIKLGKVCVEIYHRQPSLLSHLPLANFNEGGLRGIFLRRLWLAFRLPPIFLVALGKVMFKPGWAEHWSQFTCEYAFWYGVRGSLQNKDLWQRLTRPPVILMYHAVGAEGEPPSRYVIPIRRFSRQMSWLSHRKFNILGLEEFIKIRCANQLPPARSIVITFDDGYVDYRGLAYPVLQKYGFASTVFVVGEYVGTTNDWDMEGELAGRPLMSWPDLKEMGPNLVLVGHHGMSHVPLTGLTESQIESEIRGGKEELGHKLGRPVHVLAYPHGKYDDMTQAAIERAGFLGACGSKPGVNDPSVGNFALRRLEIKGTDSLITFILSLWFGKNRPLSRLWHSE